MPEADILKANILAQHGEHQAAYGFFRDSEGHFREHRHRASPMLLEAVTKALIKETRHAEAIDLCRKFLDVGSKDRPLTNVERAEVQLLLGDVQFARERYDLARDEYLAGAWQAFRESRDRIIGNLRPSGSAILFIERLSSTRPMPPHEP